MAWCALVRSWNSERKSYQGLTLRIEDTQEPGCLIRLYDGESAVGQALTDTPQQAMAEAVQLARAYLKDASITEDSVSWVQVP